MKVKESTRNATGVSPNMVSGPDVLILYEDFTTGLRAKYALDRVARQLDQEADFFNLRLWSFGLLDDPALRQQSAKQATKFEIIIFSAHDGDEPPPMVKEWLAEWMKQKRAPNCAFVVSLDEPAMKTAEESALVAYLKGAVETDVDLLCPASPAEEEKPGGIIQQLMQRATNSSSVLEAILNQWETNPSWGVNRWGINE